MIKKGDIRTTKEGKGVEIIYVRKVSEDVNSRENYAVGVYIDSQQVGFWTLNGLFIAHKLYSKDDQPSKDFLNIKRKYYTNVFIKIDDYGHPYISYHDGKLFHSLIEAESFKGKTSHFQTVEIEIEI